MAKPLFGWRWEVLRSNLPSTTRLVLLTISIHMDDRGQTNGKLSPTTLTLADETGLTERTVCTHIQVAREKGWVLTTAVGSAQGWKHSAYCATFPAEGAEPPSVPLAAEGAEPPSVPLCKGAESVAEGAEPDDRKALKDVQSNATENATENATKKELTDLLTEFLATLRETAGTPVTGILEEGCEAGAKFVVEYWASHGKTNHEFDLWVVLNQALTEAKQQGLQTPGVFWLALHQLESLLPKPKPIPAENLVASHRRRATA
jgi:hypothetical protein